MSRKTDIPVIFALSRRGLGRACGKNHARLSVIGILNYDGANEVYNSIVKLAKEGRKKYDEELKAKMKETSVPSDAKMNDEKKEKANVVQ